MNPPRVSIIIPVFNEALDTLATSFFSVTQQSFKNFECIVIDESTDNILSEACYKLCLEDERFIYVHPKHRLGLPASLNLGIVMARGDLLARFDSDDICMPERLGRQVEFLDEHKDIGVLGSSIEIIDERGKPLYIRQYPLNHKLIERHIHVTTPIAHPTVMMRKAILVDCDLYDTSYKHAEDLDLWLRLLNRKVKFANLPEILVRYRQSNMIRSGLHYQYNLRARTKNISIDKLAIRLFGIGLIYLFSKIPNKIKVLVYSKLLLKKNPKISHEH